LGNLKFIKEQGIDPGELAERTESFSREGKTCVFVACSNQAVGLLALSDVAKPSAKKAVDMLHGMGLRTALITGDLESTAKAIGSLLRIKDILAEVLPGHKAEQIKALQHSGEVVAMVGDGINDAPALTAADIGIAIGAGTDVAIEASDITLIKDDLLSVPMAIKLSAKTMDIIKQNLFWAFFYNSLGIPIAAGILYPFFGILLNPVFAAAAMALSSVSVVSNSLRLRHSWGKALRQYV
jgi:Cu+-exporting ATPase